MLVKDVVILLDSLVKLPTSEHAAFIRSVQVAGDDEAPRKVYADWLDEKELHDEAVYHRTWSAKVENSRAWLEEFCHRYCADYTSLVSGAANGSGYCFGDDDGPYNVNDEFWEHLENVKQTTFDAVHR